MGLKLFGKKEGQTAAGAAVQVRQTRAHPFGMLEQYTPSDEGQLALYRTIRQAVPIVDAAVLKLVRLCGGFEVRAREERAQEALEKFVRTVNTGRGQRGLQSFLDCYLDSMLTYGRGIGEIVLSPAGREIGAVLCVEPELVDFWQGETPLDFLLCTRDEKGRKTALAYQDLLLFTPFQPETANPYGVSLMRSMPFLTDILLKIYEAMGKNWERMGNVRFSVVYKPQEDERAFAQERCDQLAQEWSSAMQETRRGSVRDFVAVGDVEIRAIGADNQILDSAVPVKQILEQLIARTGIPPFMLGLSWSSTERMSAQQADMMTSEISAIRRSLDPVLERICDLWLRLHGYSGGVFVQWEDINLQDLVEEAKAQLYLQQAQEIRRRNEE